jgi:hypothetical protein
MSKTARSDWAASCPWGGITDKPAGLGGATDIGQLKAVGFTSGQIARWNGTKFVPYTIPPAPAPDPTPVSPLPAQEQFVWDTPSLLPLQSAYEDFPMLGALPGEPVAHGISFDPQFCWTDAKVIANDMVRLTVLNMNSVAVDLGAGTWNIQRF